MNDRDDDARDIIPPHDLDAEGVILSALLMGSPQFTLTRVRGAGLLASHFYSDSNRRIFAACEALDESGQSYDVVSVVGWLRTCGQLQATGGSPYLALLADTQPATAKPEAHALTVVELWRRRQFLELTERLQIQLRHGELDSDGAYREMKAFYAEQRAA
jgi:replicative DNA helicase